MLIIVTSDTHKGFTEKTHRRHEKFWSTVAQQNPDLLLIAGDLTTKYQKTIVSTFRQIRKHLSCDIAMVWGNHDYWDGEQRFRHIQQFFEWHAKCCQDFNIIDLNIRTYETDRIWVTGFDGWYGSVNPPSNDLHWMPTRMQDCPTHHWMNKRADTALNNILQNIPADPRVKICVTHFPPFNILKFGDANRYKSFGYHGDEFNANPRYLEFIQEKFRYLVCGHSHQEVNTEYQGLGIINPGSDYELPKFITLDIPDESGPSKPIV